LRERDADWLIGFGGFLGLALGFALGVQGFGFAEENPAEAGSLFLLDFFRVGSLFGRGDEGAVFVLVDFTDDGGGILQTHVSCAFGSANMGRPSVVVLGGDLQSVDEDAGTARVDSVGGEREDYIGQRQLDGVGVVERGELVGGVLQRDIGFVSFVFR
jgi:hypothetical protein